MPRLNCNGVNLPEKYRPERLRNVVGQSDAIEALSTFVDSVLHEAVSGAFIFFGPTGVGKTAAARALAVDLGCSLDDSEMGGVYEIASGKQDGKTVEDLLRNMRTRPFYGSGWRVAIINEADKMTTQAEAIWLDALECLPPKTVIVFTTNQLGQLSDRLIGRCELHSFSGTSSQFRRAFSRLVRKVWKQETGLPMRRVPEGLGCFELASGELSIRLAFQQIAPYIRLKRELPEAFDVPFIRETTVASAAAKKAWATRRQNRSESGVGHA